MADENAKAAPRVTLLLGWLRRMLERPGARWAPLVLGMLLCLPYLGAGFQADDHGLRYRASSQLSAPWAYFDFSAGGTFGPEEGVELGMFGWWVQPDAKMSFFRPLSSLTHALDFALWPETPALMHLQNLLWYAAMLLVAQACLRRFINTRWIALLAALLFALDDTHGMAASWISGRNMLLSGLCGFAVLLLHDRWRRDGSRVAAWLGVAVLVVGLLAGEAALFVGGYLLAYALVFDRGSRLSRALSLVPYGAIAVGWWIAYRFAGFGTSNSDMYLDPVAQPLTFAYGALRNPVLVNFAGLTVPVANPALMFPLPTVDVVAGVALVGLVGLVVLWWPLLREDRSARFLALGALLCILPFAATHPQDRFAIYSGLGSMGLLACWLASVQEGRQQGRLVSVVAGVLLFMNMGLGPLVKSLSHLNFLPIDNVAHAMARALPDGPDAGEKTVIIVDLPSEIPMLSAAAVRSRLGPMPAHLYPLHAGQAPLTVTRSAVDCLDLSPTGGWFQSPFELLFWSHTNPFVVGQSIPYQGMEVTVLDVSEDGRPTSVRFCFGQDLEDADMELLIWRGKDLGPFTPPAIGQSLSLEATRLF